MSKRKKKSKNNQYSDYEDFEEVRGKGTRKNKRKAKRHYDKKLLDEVVRGDIINEEFNDYIEGSS
jgi:hypothetical protein